MPYPAPAKNPNVVSMLTPQKRQALLLAVVNAALDQPAPTPELQRALNEYLIASDDDLAVTAPMKALTSTEKAVADFLGCSGFTVPQVAAVLGISDRTVEFHIGNIADKLPNPNGLKRMRLVAEWGLRQAALGTFGAAADSP